MKIKVVVICILLFSVLAYVAISQVQTTSVSAIQNEECTTSYYTENDPVYGYVERIRNTTGTCFNSDNSSYYTCVNGTEQYQNHEITGYIETLKNSTTCKPSSFEISINHGFTTQTKKIDFSNWGVCIQENEGSCIAVLCGTYKGGSEVNGVFNGCDGGKACKKFLFCEDGVQVLVKNSNPEFVRDDPSYNLPPLNVVEVEQ